MTLEHFHLLWSVSGAKKKPLQSATDMDGQCLILPCSRKAPAIVSLPFPARANMPGLRSVLQE
jgi:hypothetical protein